MSDKEEILITTEQYEAIKLAQRVGKRNEPLEITDRATGKLIYDGQIWDVRKFRLSDYQIDANAAKEDENIRKEMSRRYKLKAIRTQWTEKFLQENDQDGSIMKNAKDEARERMATALSKWMVWEKFIEELAKVIIREAYQH